MTTEPSCASQGPYRPDWESLDRHPLPEWFDDAKFAMFIHYGPYSSEQCGAHEFMKPECLTGEKYDPRQWVRIAADAGMRYIIFTTKHGGGYAMYDSDHTRWCSVHSGPRRDFFGELVEACREEGMRIFAYYCKGDIFLPTDARTYHFLIKDREKFDRIVEQYGMRSITEHWVEYFHNQIKEICTKYRPDGFWFDGTMLDYNWTRMPELVAWIYNNYPEMVLNDRVGCFSQRKVHGDYWTYERGWIKPVHVLPHKWQRDTSMGGGCVYDPKLSLADMAPAERVIWASLYRMGKSENSPEAQDNSVSVSLMVWGPANTIVSDQPPGTVTYVSHCWFGIVAAIAGSGSVLPPNGCWYIVP